MNQPATDYHGLDTEDRSSADRRRFAAMYRDHLPTVSAYALRRTDPEDAADVVSETFIVAWRRLDRVPAEPSTMPWLLGVARRTLANQRRSRQRRTNLVQKISTHLAPPLAALSSQPGDLESFTEALDKLKPADREILLLLAWDELTPAEIAVTLGLSGGVVRKRLFRARKRFANALEETNRADEYDDHIVSTADASELLRLEGLATR